MLKKAIVTAALTVCLGVGIGERIVAQEKYTVDRVVAVVGNSAILYSDVEATAQMLVERRRQEGYTSDRDPQNEALEALLLQKLLYNQALIDSVQINEGAIAQNIEAHVNSMIEEAGSIAALEEQMKRPIFDIRQTLRQRVEEEQYAQSMRYEIESKVRITPGEVERFYRKIDKDSLPIIPDQYVYAQITKYPASTKEAKQRVRERLLEMRERIINGDNFERLARFYSVDVASAIRGGEMDFTPLDGFVKPFADALAKLKPGQISEVVETEYGFHIIQLIERKGNLYKCRHILLRPIFSDDELSASQRSLDSLVNLIRLDSTTFEKAAIEYSDDKYSKQNGGLVTNHEMMEMYGANDTSYSTTRFLREELPRGDYNAIRSLKPGEISDVFQSEDLRGNVLHKVIKLLEIIPAHQANLNNDYLRVEQQALVKKQGEEFQKWLNQKIKSIYVLIAPEFRDGEFENKNWVK